VEKQILEVRVIRDPKEKKMELFLKIAPEVEELFKKTKDVSSSAPFGMHYYRERADTTSQYYDDADGHMILFYYTGRKYSINFAITRFVGASEGITIPVEQVFPYDGLENSVKEFVEEYRRFYKKYVTKCSIKATLVTEVET